MRNDIYNLIKQKSSLYVCVCTYVSTYVYVYMYVCLNVGHEGYKCPHINSYNLESK